MEDGPAFRWIDKASIHRRSTWPDDAFVLERMTNLNYYGLFRQIDYARHRMCLRKATIARVGFRGAGRRPAECTTATSSRWPGSVADLAEEAEGPPEVPDRCELEVPRRSSLWPAGADRNPAEVAWRISGPTREARRGRSQGSRESDQISRRQAEQEAACDRNMAVV